MNFLNRTFHQILLTIDGGIYWAVSQVYQIFLKLANARIFEDAFFSNFSKRIYAILGVIMLFYLAYALLTYVVNPDKMTGDKGVGKLAQNIVISLALLGFLPIIFDYAYQIQGIIFKENVIGAIIFGTGGADNDATLNQYGNIMAYTALNPFLNAANYNVSLGDDYSWFNLKKDIIEDGNFLRINRMAEWAITPQPLISDALDAKTGDEVSLHYVPGISTLCGAILLYILFSFCLDLGIRIIKFAFCQLIAPIPIVMRMVPGKKGTFDKWLKLTLSVYFEVFIRIGIMYMVVYFFSEIGNLDIFKYAFQDSGGNVVVNGIQSTIVLAIILLGLLAFAKQAPKLIGEVLGLNSGNISLGIKDKLKAGGFFAAGGAIGAGVTSFANNLVSGGRRYFNANTRAGQHWRDTAAELRSGNVLGAAKNLAKAVPSTLTSAVGVATSTVAGTVSGAAHGLQASSKSGSVSDMKKAASTGANTAINNRVKREKYKAQHVNPDNKLRNVPIVGNIVADQVDVTAGHFKDMASDIRDWAGGTTVILENLQETSKSLSQLESANKELKEAIKFQRENVEKNDRVVSYKYTELSKDSRTGAITRTEKTIDNQNLALLKREYEMATKAGSGMTAIQIENLKNQVEAAEKQADNDILMGYTADGQTQTGPGGAQVRKTVDVTAYNSNIRSALTKLMTETRAASRNVNNNIETQANKTSFEQAVEFSRKNKNNNIVEEIISGRANVTQLTGNIAKPLQEAKGNVTTQINKYYQNQNKKP